MDHAARLATEGTEPRNVLTLDLTSVGGSVRFEVSIAVPTPIAQTINGLEPFKGLTAFICNGHLISRIEGLLRLTQLRDLQLADNKLVRVDGIERLSSLERVNLSGNLIERVPKGFQRLAALRVLRLSRNRIRSASDLDHLRPLKNLSNISLHGNPVASSPAYRSSVLPILLHVTILDGTAVEDSERAEVANAQTDLTQAYDRSQRHLRKANQEQQSMREENERLRETLAVKSDLLHRKSAELGRTCELLYGLEQELAFYKIDHAGSMRLLGRKALLGGMESDIAIRLRGERSVLGALQRQASAGDEVGDERARRKRGLNDAVFVAEQLQQLSEELADRIRLVDNEKSTTSGSNLSGLEDRLGKLRDAHGDVVDRLQEALDIARRAQSELISPSDVLHRRSTQEDMCVVLEEERAGIEEAIALADDADDGEQSGERLVQSESALKEQETEAIRLRQKCESLEEMNDVNESRCRELEAIVDALRVRAEEAEDVTHTLQKQLDAAESERSEKTAGGETDLDTIETALSELASAKAELVLLRIKASDSELALSNESAARKAAEKSKESTLKKLKSTEAEAARQKKQEAEAYAAEKNAVSEKNVRIAQLEQSLRENEDLVSALEDQKQSLEDDLSNSRVELAEMPVLKQRIELLEEDARVHASRTAHWEAQVQTLNAAKERVIELEKKIEHQKVLIDEMKKENELLKMSDKADERVIELEKKIEHQKALIDEMRKENELLKTNEEADRRVVELESVLHRQEAEINDRAHDIHQLRVASIERDEAVKQWQDAAQISENRMVAAQSEVESLVDSVAQRDGVIRRQRATIEELSNALSSGQMLLEKVKEVDQCEQCQHYEHQLSRIQANADAHDATVIGRLSALVSALERSAHVSPGSHSTTSIDSLVSTLGTHVAQIIGRLAQSANASDDEGVQKIRSRLMAAEARAARAEITRDSLQASLNTLSTDTSVDDLKQRVEQAERTSVSVTEGSTARVAVLQSEIDRLANQLEKKTRKCAELNVLLDTKSVALEVAEVELISLRTQLISAQHDLTQARDTEEPATALLQKRESTVRELKAKVDGMNHDLAILRTEKASLSSKISGLEDSNSKAEQVADNIRSHIEATLNQSYKSPDPSLPPEVIAICEELTSMRNLAKTASNEAQSIRQALETQHAQLATAQLALRRANEMQSERSALIIKAEEAEDELKDMKMKDAHSQRLISGYLDQIASLKRQSEARSAVPSGRMMSAFGGATIKAKTTEDADEAKTKLKEAEQSLRRAQEREEEERKLRMLIEDEIKQMKEQKMANTEEELIRADCQEKVRIAEAEANAASTSLEAAQSDICSLGEEIKALQLTLSSTRDHAHAQHEEMLRMKESMHEQRSRAEAAEAAELEERKALEQSISQLETVKRQLSSSVIRAEAAESAEEAACQTAAVATREAERLKSQIESIDHKIRTDEHVANLNEAESTALERTAVAEARATRAHRLAEQSESANVAAKEELTRSMSELQAVKSRLVAAAGELATYAKAKNDAETMLAELRGRLAREMGQLEAQRDEMSRAMRRASNEDIERELRIARAELTEANQRASEAEQQLVICQNKSIQQSTQPSELPKAHIPPADLSSLEHRIHEQDAEIARLLSAMDQMDMSASQQQPSLSGDVARLKGEVDGLNKSLNVAESEATRLRQESAACRTKLANCESDLMSVKRERDALRQIAGLTTSLYSTESRAVSAETALSGLEHATSALQQDVMRAEQRLHMAEEGKKMLQGRLNEAEESSGKLYGEISASAAKGIEAESTIKRLNEEISALTAECKVLADAMRQRENKEGEAKTKAEAAKSKLAQFESEYHHRSQVFKETEMKLKQMVAMAREEAERASQAQHLAESELETIRVEMQKLKDEVTRGQRESVQLAMKKKEEEDMVMVVQVGLSEWKKKANEASSEVAQLRSELEGERVKRMTAEQAHANCDGSISELKASIEQERTRRLVNEQMHPASSSEVAQLRSELEGERVKRMTAEQAHANCDGSISELKASIEQAHSAEVITHNIIHTFQISAVISRAAEAESRAQSAEAQLQDALDRASNSRASTVRLSESIAAAQADALKRGDEARHAQAELAALKHAQNEIVERAAEAIRSAELKAAKFEAELIDIRKDVELEKSQHRATLEDLATVQTAVAKEGNDETESAEKLSAQVAFLVSELTRARESEAIAKTRAAENAGNAHVLAQRLKSVSHLSAAMQQPRVALDQPTFQLQASPSHDDSLEALAKRVESVAVEQKTGEQSEALMDLASRLRSAPATTWWHSEPEEQILQTPEPPRSAQPATQNKPSPPRRPWRGQASVDAEMDAAEAWARGRSSSSSPPESGGRPGVRNWNERKPSRRKPRRKQAGLQLASSSLIDGGSGGGIGIAVFGGEDEWRRARLASMRM